MSEPAASFTNIHSAQVELAGAVVGPAAVLDGQVPIKDKTVATVNNGGNIDRTQGAALTGDME